MGGGSVGREIVYASGMDQQQIIEKHLKAATDRAFWPGATLGIVGGFVAGVLFW
jgi:hypothetical protein